MALIEKQHVSIATMCVVIIAIASGVFVIGRYTEKIDTALTALSEHIGEHPTVDLVEVNKELLSIKTTQLVQGRQIVKITKQLEAWQLIEE